MVFGFDMYFNPGSDFVDCLVEKADGRMQEPFLT